MAAMTAGARVDSGKSSPAGSSGRSAIEKTLMVPSTMYAAKRLHRLSRPRPLGPGCTSSTPKAAVSDEVGSPIIVMKPFDLSIPWSLPQASITAPSFTQ
eukprot:scaffold42957_cov31-Tisochrysis_lutea.AAC.2